MSQSTARAARRRAQRSKSKGEEPQPVLIEAVPDAPPGQVGAPAPAPEDGSMPDGVWVQVKYEGVDANITGIFVTGSTRATEITGLLEGALKVHRVRSGLEK